jgi:hypothetical protein
MLQELTVSSYVPNDTFLVGGILEQSADYSNRAPEALRTGSSPAMLLLTGPNYSGKSVYMKQVGNFEAHLKAQTDGNLGCVDGIPGTNGKVNPELSIHMYGQTANTDKRKASFQQKVQRLASWIRF